MNGRRPAADWKALLGQIPGVGGDWQGAGIEKFVHKAIKQWMPKNMPLPSGLSAFLPKTLDYEWFETHRSIFVRCSLPGDIPPGSVRLYTNRRKLIVEYDGKSEEILLPGEVNASRTIARHYDGVLEIRLPKSTDAEPLREIFIKDGGK